MRGWPFLDRRVIWDSARSTSFLGGLGNSIPRNSDMRLLEKDP